MVQPEMDVLQRRIEDEVKTRFSEGVVRRVDLLQYGDEPAIEPGVVLVRAFVDPPPGEPDDREPLVAFEDVNRKAMKKLRRDLTNEFPEVRELEFICETPEGESGRVMLQSKSALGERSRTGGDLTPVMARLGPVDLETLDTLITAGIAVNRAEAVRWALARIRERAAYRELRERALEIERLRTEF